MKSKEFKDYVLHLQNNGLCYEMAVIHAMNRFCNKEDKEYVQLQPI